jgi:general secretion pathway protein C
MGVLSMKFDLYYLLSAKYAQWIIMGLICLFSILILMEWSTLKFSAVNVYTPPEKNILIRPKKNVSDSILRASLFGVYVPNDLNESSVKKSMLNVTLVGILFADKLNDSQVIIRAANGSEKAYKVGDSIPGDAVIKRIMAHGILVEHHGAMESLSLPKNELNFEPLAKPLQEE